MNGFSKSLQTFLKGGVTFSIQMTFIIEETPINL